MFPQNSIGITIFFWCIVGVLVSLLIALGVAVERYL